MKNLLMFFAALAVFAGCAEKPYVIVQIADAQLGFTAADRCQSEGIEFDNDLTYETECLIKAVRKINEIRPDAVVFTGDQVNYPDNEQQWDTFNEIVTGLDKRIKVFHIPGNHDVYLNAGKVDSTPFTDRYGDDRFVFSEKGVKIVGINTNLIQHDDDMEYDQIDWLEVVLEKNPQEQVTVIFGHHPFFLSDIDEPDSYFPIKQSKRHRYFELFKDFDVDAVYAGHRHETFEGEFNGIPMKTTTSVAYQIGKSKPSIRVITIDSSAITDFMLEL